MRISAIMPTYNQAAYLEAAVQSVRHQVDELIVVDDGSTDGTRGILESLGVRYLSHESNKGSAAAINTGYAASTGDAVTWVSSDNVHDPQWRELLEDALDFPGIGAVYSAYRYGIGGPVYFTPYDPAAQIERESCLFGPSFLILREVWNEAGEVRGRISHDLDHWLRVEEACEQWGLEIVSLPEALCDYRTHDQRASVLRGKEYDAPHWLEVGRMRRRARAAGALPADWGNQC